jgi:hypothetical protein
VTVLLEQKLLYPASIVIAGGGRWARVFITEIDGLLPPDCQVVVFTPRNIQGMQDWVGEREWQQNYIIIEDRPQLGRSSVLIVANATHDHSEVVKYGLQAGATVLVEKPAAMNLEEFAEYELLEQQHGGRLLTAHVFLFARYIGRFKESLELMNGVKELSFTWRDPINEIRHGERKSYDPLTPIYLDVLPHVVSILDFLFPDNAIEYHQIENIADGVALLNLNCGPVVVRLVLERDVSKRVRLIEAKDREGKGIMLDFTNGAGRIYDGLAWDVADKLWDKGLRPVASMLETLVSSLRTGRFDARLEWKVARHTLELIKIIEQKRIR